MTMYTKALEFACQKQLYHILLDIGAIAQTTLRMFNTCYFVII